MRKLAYRKIQSFQAIITVFVLFASFYFEYAMGLQPCPLCVMQRICVFVLLGLMGLSLRTLKKAHIVSFMQFLVACAGLYFSLRQLWLQSLPPEQAPACMPGLDVLIQYFPWQAIAKALFWGAGDCAEVKWTMFGISMPGWTAMYFLFMAIMGLFLFFRTRTIN